MYDNKSIVIISPPAVSVTYKNDQITSLRINTPEYTLALIGTIIKKHFPFLDVNLISLKRNYDPEFDSISPKRIPYGDKEISVDYLGKMNDIHKTIVRNSDLLLFTSNHTQESGACLKTISAAKKVNKKAMIIVGGIDATFRPEYYLLSGADIVVRGESEKTLPLVLDRILNNKGIEDIPNIAWKSKSSEIRYTSMMKKNYTSLWLPDLQLLPDLDFESVVIGTELHEGKPPEGVSERSIYLETSRGCIPGNCCFCTCGPRTGGAKGYRRYTLSCLESYIDKLLFRGVSTIQIIDDNVLARLSCSSGRQELYDFFLMLRKKNIAWEFSTGLQLSKLVNGNRPDQELIDILFSSECYSGNMIRGGYRSFIPIETSLKDSRPVGYEVWDKMEGVNIEEIYILLDSLSKANVLMLSLGVMIGFPHDTYKDIEETVKGMELVESYLHRINEQRIKEGKEKIRFHWDIMTFMLLPGTGDFVKYRNRILFNDDYYTYPELLNFQTAAYNPYNMKYWELTDIRKSIAESFNAVDQYSSVTMSSFHKYR